MISSGVVSGVNEFFDGLEKLFRRRVGDSEFAEAVAKKIVEAIKKGYKVYVTDRAAKVLEPILAKYGIVLVPVKKVEYPHILIDIPDGNTIYLRLGIETHRKLERELALQMFIEYLEKELKKLSVKKRVVETIRLFECLGCFGNLGNVMLKYFFYSYEW